MSTDVMPAYKQTNTGIVPDGWEVKALGHVVSSLEAGVSVRSIPTADAQGAGYAVLKTSAVENGRLLVDECKPIHPGDIHRARMTLKADTILISRMNTIDLVGESGYVDKDYDHLFLPDRLWMTGFRSQDGISVKWLAYVLSSRWYREELRSIATGTSGSMKNISKASLLALPIPCPPRNEQAAIAEALGDADAYIESLEQLIAKEWRIKQGAMQELLTGQRRLPGFEVQPGHRTTEIGVIPEDWDTCPLGQVGKWLSGGTPSMSNPAYWDGDIPWISAKDMKVSRVHDSQDHITLKAVTDGARLVPPGTVLMVIRGMILAHTFPVARAECPLAFNQDLKAVVAADQIDSTYLLFWLMGNAQFFLGLTTESTHGTKRLPPEAFFRVPFPLPMKVEQAAIADVISDMDAEITTLETKLAKARDVKQGMMQELLTGRIRLV